MCPNLLVALASHSTTLLAIGEARFVTQGHPKLLLLDEKSYPYQTPAKRNNCARAIQTVLALFCRMD